MGEELDKLIKLRKTTSSVEKSEKFICTMKYSWDDYKPLYKYNFIPLEQNSPIKMLIPIADDKTGEIHSCEIKDKGYCIL